MLRKASMLGRLTAGPARSKAKAGPWPIPKSINDLKIGTSVRVAKYISAPLIEAVALACRLLPPRKPAITDSGITTFRIPAMKTPPISQGTIILANEPVV